MEKYNKPELEILDLTEENIMLVEEPESNYDDTLSGKGSFKKSGI